MDHEKQLQNLKYRNWVKGGLAYKYLRDGISDFAEYLVQVEHTRILNKVNHRPGVSCTQCNIKTLKPLHTSLKDSNTGKLTCPLQQLNCNCLFRKKTSCRANICDKIAEEIILTHDGTPPAPNWKNTNIQQWCLSPWEIAKCFISAPGYTDKLAVSDIDVAGLLHLFINNTHLQHHVTCNIDGSDPFSKALRRRNTIFHSATMEMNDSELNACIEEILSILEDDKELKGRQEATAAVQKLNQLKSEDFIITIHNEMDVCRDAMASIVKWSGELEQLIEDAKSEIESKQTDVSKTIDDRTNAALQEAIKNLDDEKESRLQAMKQSIKVLRAKVERLEIENADIKYDLLSIKERLLSIGKAVNRLEDVRHAQQEKFNFVKNKQDLQCKLLKLYQQHYVKTSPSPLNSQDNSIDINEVYVTPKMVMESLAPSQSSDRHNSAVKATPKGNALEEIKITQRVKKYEEIFLTRGRENKRIYVIGEVGTGKSAYCKQVVHHWIKATDVSQCSTDSDDTQSLRDCNVDIEFMKNFDFLFYIPLRNMPGTANLTEMIKLQLDELSSTIDEVFLRESEKCLILADGLDEWEPDRKSHFHSHVTYGIPMSDKTKRATVITTSRPSAHGIINMKTTESDLKVVLLGIELDAVKEMVEKYMAKMDKKETLSVKHFLNKMENFALKYIRQTPLLLQQLIWMHCSGYKIDDSATLLSITIVNIVLGWLHEKEGRRVIPLRTPESMEQFRVSNLCDKYPRIKTNKNMILTLGQIAFDVFTSETYATSYSVGRSHLEDKYTDDTLSLILKSGFLTEERCFDKTFETSHISFTNTFYFDFFTAFYVAGSTAESDLADSKEICSNSEITILDTLLDKYDNNKDGFLSANSTTIDNLSMICTFAPFTLTTVLRYIYTTTSDNENFRECRIAFPYRYLELQECQSLIDNILTKIGVPFLDNAPKAFLADVVFKKDAPSETLLQIICPEHVLSLVVAPSFTDIDFAMPLKLMGALQNIQSINIAFQSLTHEAFLELTSSLKNMVTLKQLVFCNIKCNRCANHHLELPDHTRLHTFVYINEWSMSDMLRIGINTTNLRKCIFRSSEDTDLAFLRNAKHLKQLSILSGKKCISYSSQLSRTVHSLPNVEELLFERLNFEDIPPTVSPEMSDLKRVTFRYSKISFANWNAFLDSVGHLKQNIDIEEETSWKK